MNRYDGRGHLYNLAQYEAGCGKAEESLGDLERHEEELCEEERWRSLQQQQESEEEESVEDSRPEQRGGAEFHFSYDVGGGDADVFGPENSEVREEDEIGYTPAPELDLPIAVKHPKNQKQFSVIEKTALLIGEQGPQMEILLKAKQAGNSAFGFLGHEHELHSFYRHIVNLVKTKRYGKQRVNALVLAEAPVMASVAMPSLAPKVPSVPFKRSEDCAYSQLISKLQKFVPAPAKPSAPPPEPEPASQPIQSQAAEKVARIPEPPPQDLQTTIDKMASYVARNGRSFEEVVLAKDKNRFKFLSPDDFHHQYYLYKLNIYTSGKLESNPTSQSVEAVTFKLKKLDNNKDNVVIPSSTVISSLDYESESEDCPEEEGQSKENVENVGSITQISAEPKNYKDEEAKAAEKKKMEEEKIRIENTNKLRDKLAAKAKEKMVQV